MLVKAAGIQGGIQDKQKMLDFIIESNKASLKKHKQLGAVLYLENGGEWELYFIDNDSHEKKVAFWDDVLEYIRKNNTERFFMAGDYKITDVETGKRSEALVVTYADKNLITEQYTVPYKRKLLGGVVFAGTEKTDDLTMPYHESIFDYWENGNRNIDRGLKRYALPYGFKIYFPKQWANEIDEEDGHDIFFPESEKPVVHISVIRPVKKDGSLSTDAELAQYAEPNGFRVKRDDLQFSCGLFTVNFYENNETAENGKTLQSIQCSAIYDGCLLYATVAAEEMKDCEQAVPYLKTLTHKKSSI